jgi:hypothetical protein
MCLFWIYINFVGPTVPPFSYIWDLQIHIQKINVLMASKNGASGCCTWVLIFCTVQDTDVTGPTE